MYNSHLYSSPTLDDLGHIYSCMITKWMRWVCADEGRSDAVHAMHVKFTTLYCEFSEIQ